MKLYATLIIGFIFLFVLNGCSGVKKAEEPNIEEALKQIESEDIDIRTKAAAIILREGEGLEEEIIQIAKKYMKDESRRGTAKTLIDLLGSLKSVKAIPILVENITIEVFYKEVKRPQLMEDRFPCINALIKIGEPSLNPILEKVSDTDEAKVYLCSAHIFKGFLGKNDAVTFIEDYIKEQDSEVVSKRLRVLIKNIQELVEY